MTTQREKINNNEEEYRTMNKVNIFTLNPIRMIAWVCAIGLLCIPLIAMQYTDEVNWSVFDFLVMASLIAIVGLSLEKAITLSNDSRYRVGVTILLFSLFLLVWVNLSVGLIGGEQNALNFIYVSIPITIFIMSYKSSFSAISLFYASILISFIQALITSFAIIFEWGHPYDKSVLLLFGNGIFIILYLFAASFFYTSNKKCKQNKTSAN